ncbi:MAG: DUF2378 family protein [Myxococcus sp.]|nr:DUF2378 family protein [Myxococcus sp.]
MTSPTPLVFATAFDGLSRAFVLAAPTKRRLLALGVDFGALEASYPLATFLAALDVVATSLDHLGTPLTRYRLLGRAYVSGWVQTTSGKATMTVGRLLGPKRMMMRMQATFATSANYVKTEVTPQPPKALELIVKTADEFVPNLPSEAGRLIDYRHGLLEGIVEQYGVKDHVDVVERDDVRLMARYLVKW